MRSNVDPQKIEQLMKALGREARGSGCIYFTGGASALLIGWRSSTVDIDIRLDPEPPGIFQANEIESELIRFPALDPDLLRNKIEQFIDRCENTSERK
jgi:hypothetical protein